MPSLAPLVGVVAFFLLWEGALVVFGVKGFVMPRPSKVLNAMWNSRSFFLTEAWVTAREALLGLLFGFLGALVLAVPMARWRPVERGMQPVATLVQVIPLVCYAPAFVIWLGPGQQPIIAVAALVSMLPMLLTLVAGFRSVDPAARELLMSVGARRREVWWRLELPTAVPFFLAGLRTSIGLSLIGAVLGEWFALVSHGLGVQIRSGASHNSATLVWGSAYALGLMGGIGLVIVNILERALLHWHPSQHS